MKSFLVTTLWTIPMVVIYVLVSHHPTEGYIFCGVLAANILGMTEGFIRSGE